MVNSRRADSGDPAGADAGWCFGRLEIGFGPWQVQKASGFVGNVVEIGEAAGRADYVEQVAVFAGCCIRPFAGCALASLRTFQAHEHRASGRVLHVPDQPVAAFTATVRKIAAAHGLGLARETVRQFACISGHGHSARHAGALLGQYGRERCFWTSRFSATGAASLSRNLNPSRPTRSALSL
jgi:hypothetical protein